MAVPDFEDTLARFLDEAVVDTEAYPNLRLLCWNRAERYIPGRDALALYERNWRFVDERSLELQERELIGRLVHAYGRGLLNV